MFAHTPAALRVVPKSLLAARAAAQAARHAVAEPAPLHAQFLNTAPRFWEAYRARPGAARRQALLALFQQYPDGQLPVNNRYQANLADPDLAVLLKRGLLRRVRGGRRQHPLNRSSAKRQTYLVLA
jgi:hypothetical protein